MKGNNYIKNIIYEEPSSQEKSNTNSILKKKNSLEKIIITSTTNNNIEKRKYITNNDINLDNIYLNEETSFCMKSRDKFIMKKLYKLYDKNNSLKMDKKFLIDNRLNIMYAENEEIYKDKLKKIKPKK